MDALYGIVKAESTQEFFLGDLGVNAFVADWTASTEDTVVAGVQKSRNVIDGLLLE